MTHDMTHDPAHDPAHDPERDAWLTEALRHAPDAHAAPPAALSEAILRQARAATNAARAPQSVRARSRWLAVWDALARPSVAAGFASVMVATVVGVMWWGQPMDATIARAPAVDATPPSPAVDATPPSPAVDAKPPSPAVTAPSQPEAPPATPAPEAAAKSVAPAPPKTAALPQRAAPKPAPKRDETGAAPGTGSVSAAAPAPRREDPEPFADRRVAEEAAAPAAEPAPLARRAREPGMSAAPQSKVEAPRDEARALGSAGALASRAVPRAAPPAALRADSFAEARPATLGALLASIGEQPERWAWERSGTPRPITPALRRWLGQVEAATAAARPGATTDSASSGESAVLRLYRDGVLSATLRLDDASVGLVAGPRTALPPAALAALKQALDDATR